MDIEIGSEIEIQTALNFPTQTVTVTGIRMLVDDNAIKAIVTIDGGDGQTTVGALQLAKWVEKAERQYR